MRWLLMVRQFAGRTWYLPLLASATGWLLSEEALDDHGDKHALDHDADDGFSSGEPGLQAVEVELGEEGAPVDGVDGEDPAELVAIAGERS
jgi:hypothetical protein